MNDSSDATPLARAIVRLLRPLVRLALRRGMAFGRFEELAKRAYVDVARSDFAVPGRKLTISRIAVITGLTRKEAKRVMDETPTDPERNARKNRFNRAARVVSAWVADDRYHDRRGAPASLPFEAEHEVSFAELVRDYGADVTPRAVLDELLRVGAVERLRNGRFRLVERAYIPQSDEAEKLEILGSDVADLIGSIEHNLDAGSGALPFFQRKVAYDNLPAAWLPELQAIVRARGQALLEELNEQMSEQDLDVHPDPEAHGGSRAMVGVYYFEQGREREDSDEEAN